MSHGHKPYWLSELGVWGRPSLAWMVIFKIGMLEVLSKPFISRGDTEESLWIGMAQCHRSQLYGTEPGMEFMVRLCLSLSCQYFWCISVGIFSFAWCGKVTQLVSGFLSEGTAPCVAIHSMHPREEGSLVASCLTILVPPWHFYFFIFFQKELEKQKRIKRNQQLEAIAKEHYERVLLRKKGLEPWKRLKMQSMQNLQV